MKLFEKFKNIFANKDSTKSGRLSKKVFFSLVILMVNVISFSAATLAWFAILGKESTMDMVSGDLDIDINKITAYKWNYPFYEGSTEFINYDSPNAVVKKCVIEDDNFQSKGSFNDVTISLDDSLIDYPTGNTPSATYIPDYNETTNLFRYYLIGDAVFTDDNVHPWSFASGFGFSSKDNPTASQPIVLNNVTMSVGSCFSFVDTDLIKNEGKCFKYTCSSTNFFETSNDGEYLLCKKSGIYKFTYTHDSKLIISLARQDGAIIGNNSLDSTKINIDYIGSADKELYPQLANYVPKAINEQNTMVILDVELTYNNGENDIAAGLTVKRKELSSNSIYNKKSPSELNGYVNTTYDLTGYNLATGERNPLNASDFYSFYAVFVKEDSGTIPALFSNADSLWRNLHKMTNGEDPRQNEDLQAGDIKENIDSFAKFNQNPLQFDRELDCASYLFDANDSDSDNTYFEPINNNSLRVIRSSSDNKYHCYICIEYDDEYAMYFLNENRLGKTYFLDRDFGFYFSAKQILEEA